ncbi:uncharacterized protein LOC101848140 [Aplysia californica]|uniref:Uncharacterized protein LOC101848140 n=1 Tax=Aplysia californica TaxID=6500 RepID=A0ABM0K288_APLCA|nr:uncharacterized protein LOC101848140 [Aplysia californica]
MDTSAMESFGNLCPVSVLGKDSEASNNEDDDDEDNHFIISLEDNGSGDDYIDEYDGEGAHTVLSARSLKSPRVSTERGNEEPASCVTSSQEAEHSQKQVFHHTSESSFRSMSNVSSLKPLWFSSPSQAHHPSVVAPVENPQGPHHMKSTQPVSSSMVITASSHYQESFAKKEIYYGDLPVVVRDLSFCPSDPKVSRVSSQDINRSETEPLTSLAQTPYSQPDTSQGSTFPTVSGLEMQKGYETVHLGAEGGGIWSEAVFVSSNYTPFTVSSSAQSIETMSRTDPVAASCISQPLLSSQTTTSSVPCHPPPVLHFPAPKLAGPFPCRTKCEEPDSFTETIREIRVGTKVVDEQASEQHSNCHRDQGNQILNSHSSDLSEKECTCIMCFKGRGIVDWYPPPKEPTLSLSEEVMITGKSSQKHSRGGPQSADKRNTKKSKVIEASSRGGVLINIAPSKFNPISHSFSTSTSSSPQTVLSPSQSVHNPASAVMTSPPALSGTGHLLTSNESTSILQHVGSKDQVNPGKVIFSEIQGQMYAIVLAGQAVAQGRPVAVSRTVVPVSKPRPPTSHVCASSAKSAPVVAHSASVRHTVPLISKPSLLMSSPNAVVQSVKPKVFLKPSVSSPLQSPSVGKTVNSSSSSCAQVNKEGKLTYSLLPNWIPRTTESCAVPNRPVCTTSSSHIHVVDLDCERQSGSTVSTPPSSSQPRFSPAHTNSISVTPTQVSHKENKEQSQRACSPNSLFKILKNAEQLDMSVPGKVIIKVKPPPSQSASASSANLTETSNTVIVTQPIGPLTSHPKPKNVVSLLNGWNTTPHSIRMKAQSENSVLPQTDPTPYRLPLVPSSGQLSGSLFQPRTGNLDTRHTLVQLINSHLGKQQIQIVDSSPVEKDSAVMSTANVITDANEARKSQPNSHILHNISSPFSVSRNPVLDNKEMTTSIRAVQRTEAIADHVTTESFEVDIGSNSALLPQDGLPSNYIEKWVQQSKTFTPMVSKVVSENDNHNVKRNNSESKTSESETDKHALVHIKSGEHVTLSPSLSEEKLTLVLPRPKPKGAGSSHQHSKIMSDAPVSCSDTETGQSDTASSVPCSPTQSLAKQTGPTLTLHFEKPLQHISFEGAQEKRHSLPVLSETEQKSPNSRSVMETEEFGQGEVSMDQVCASSTGQNSVQLDSQKKAASKRPGTPSSTVVAGSQGIKLKIKLGDQSEKVKQKSRRKTPHVIPQPEKDRSNEIEWSISEPANRDSLSVETRTTEVPEATSLVKVGNETAEEMFQRFEEQAMREVYKAQLGVGDLSRSLRPCRGTISLVDKYLPDKEFTNSKKMKTPSVKQDHVLVKESPVAGPVAEKSLSDFPRQSKKKEKRVRDRKKKIMTSMNVDNLVKSANLAIKDYPKLKQDDSITHGKDIYCPNILAGHKVHVKFNIFESEGSGRAFLIPFFNIGGTRTQFDVEDVEYIKKAVIDFEKEERSCARHLLYFTRENKKAMFLRKEAPFQTKELTEKNYKKHCHNIVGYSREAQKRTEAAPSQWKIDKKVDIEIDCAEVENDDEAEFDAVMGERSEKLVMTSKSQDDKICVEGVDETPFSVGLVTGGQEPVLSSGVRADQLDAESSAFVSLGLLTSEFGSSMQARRHQLKIPQRASRAGSTALDNFENSFKIHSSMVKESNCPAEREVLNNCNDISDSAYTEKLKELLLSENIHDSVVGEGSVTSSPKRPLELNVPHETQAGHCEYDLANNEEQRSFMSHQMGGLPKVKLEPPDDDECSMHGVEENEWTDSLPAQATQQLCNTDATSTAPDPIASVRVKEEPVDDYFDHVQMDKSQLSTERLNSAVQHSSVEAVNSVPTEGRESERDIQNGSAFVCVGEDNNGQEVEQASLCGDAIKNLNGDGQLKISVVEHSGKSAESEQNKMEVTGPVASFMEGEQEPAEEMGDKASERSESPLMSPPSDLPESLDSLVSSEDSDSDALDGDTEQTTSETSLQTPSVESSGLISGTDKGNAKISSLVDSLRQRLTQETPALPSWLALAPPVEAKLRKKKRRKRKVENENIKAVVDTEVLFTSSCSYIETSAAVQSTSAVSVIDSALLSSSDISVNSSTASSVQLSTALPIVASTTEPIVSLTVPFSFSNVSTPSLTSSVSQVVLSSSVSLSSISSPTVSLANSLMTVEPTHSNMGPKLSGASKSKDSIPSKSSVLELSKQSLMISVPETGKLSSAEITETAFVKPHIALNEISGNDSEAIWFGRGDGVPVQSKINLKVTGVDQIGVEHDCGNSLAAVDQLGKVEVGSTQVNSDKDKSRTGFLISSAPTCSSLGKTLEHTPLHESGVSVPKLAKDIVAENLPTKLSMRPPSPTSDIEIDIGVDESPETLLTFVPISPAIKAVHKHRFNPTAHRLADTRALGKYISPHKRKKTSLKNRNKISLPTLVPTAVSDLVTDYNGEKSSVGSVADYLSQKFAQTAGSGNGKIRVPRLIHRRAKVNTNVTTSSGSASLVPSASLSVRPLELKDSSESVTSALPSTKQPSLSEIFGVKVSTVESSTTDSGASAVKSQDEIPEARNLGKKVCHKNQDGYKESGTVPEEGEENDSGTMDTEDVGYMDEPLLDSHVRVSDTVSQDKQRKKEPVDENTNIVSVEEYAPVDDNVKIEKGKESKLAAEKVQEEKPVGQQLRITRGNVSRKRKAPPSKELLKAKRLTWRQMSKQVSKMKQNASDLMDQNSEPNASKLPQDTTGKNENVSNLAGSMNPCRVFLHRLEDLNLGFSGKFEEGVVVKLKSSVEISREDSVEESKSGKKCGKRKKRKALKVSKARSTRKPQRDIVDIYASMIESLQKKAQQLEEESKRKQTEGEIKQKGDGPLKNYQVNNNQNVGESMETECIPSSSVAEQTECGALDDGLGVTALENVDAHCIATPVEELNFGSNENVEGGKHVAHEDPSMTSMSEALDAEGSKEPVCSQKTVTSAPLELDEQNVCLMNRGSQPATAQVEEKSKCTSLEVSAGQTTRNTLQGKDNGETEPQAVVESIELFDGHVTGTSDVPLEKAIARESDGPASNNSVGSKDVLLCSTVEDSLFNSAISKKCLESTDEMLMDQELQGEDVGVIPQEEVEELLGLDTDENPKYPGSDNDSFGSDNLMPSEDFGTAELANEGQLILSDLKEVDILQASGVLTSGDLGFSPASSPSHSLVIAFDEEDVEEDMDKPGVSDMRGPVTSVVDDLVTESEGNLKGPRRTRNVSMRSTEELTNEDTIAISDEQDMVLNGGKQNETEKSNVLLTDSAEPSSNTQPLPASCQTQVCDSHNKKNIHVSPSWKRLLGSSALAELEKQSQTKGEMQQEKDESSDLRFKLKLPVVSLNRAVRMSKEMERVFGETDQEGSSQENGEIQHVSESSTTESDNDNECLGDGKPKSSQGYSMERQAVEKGARPKNLSMSEKTIAAIQKAKIQFMKGAALAKMAPTNKQTTQKSVSKESDAQFKRDLDFYLTKAGTNKEDSEDDSHSVFDKETEGELNCSKEAGTTTDNFTPRTRTKRKNQLNIGNSDIGIDQTSASVFPQEKHSFDKRSTQNNSDSSVLTKMQSIFSSLEIEIPLEAKSRGKSSSETQRQDKVVIKDQNLEQSLISKPKAIDLSKLKMKLNPLLLGKLNNKAVPLSRTAEVSKGPCSDMPSNSTIQSDNKTKGIRTSVENRIQLSVDSTESATSSRSGAQLDIDPSERISSVKTGVQYDSSSSSTHQTGATSRENESVKNLPVLNTAKLCNILKSFKTASFGKGKGLENQQESSNDLKRKAPLKTKSPSKLMKRLSSTLKVSGTEVLNSRSRKRTRNSRSMCSQNPSEASRVNSQMPVPSSSSVKVPVEEVKKDGEEKGERSFFDCLTNITTDAWKE